MLNRSIKQAHKLVHCTRFGLLEHKKMDDLKSKLYEDR